MKAKITKAGNMNTAWGLTRAVAPRLRPETTQSSQLSRFETTRVSQIVRVIMEKYMVSGMKYETGIAIGLSAVTDATNTDQRKVRNLSAIKNVSRTVPIKKNELIVLVQE
jgi:hypothetical protein